MVNKVVSSAMDREFDLRSGQTKDYKSDMCCFFTNHAAYRIHEKTGLLVLGLWWLTPLSTIFQLYRGLLGVRIICPNGFNEHYKNPTQHIYLVHYYIIQKN